MDAPVVPVVHMALLTSALDIIDIELVCLVEDVQDAGHQGTAVLTYCERVSKRRRVLNNLKQTDMYHLAKANVAKIAAKENDGNMNSNNMNSNNKKSGPGLPSPPMTPRDIEDMSKRDWEKQFFVFKTRLREYAQCMQAKATPDAAFRAAERQLIDLLGAAPLDDDPIEEPSPQSGAKENFALHLEYRGCPTREIETEVGFGVTCSAAARPKGVTRTGRALSSTVATRHPKRQSSALTTRLARRSSRTMRSELRRRSANSERSTWTSRPWPVATSFARTAFLRRQCSA
ncbi:unnamed protein product [Symbiodinium sp. CCMP2592]|nr:unnamed protein product [Symbiodinium sp. CCMP2592]